MIKILYTIAITLISVLGYFNSGNAQVDSFIAMDESMQQLINFYNTDTIIVITPLGYTISEDEKQIIEKFAFWRNDLTYVFIQENEFQNKYSKIHLHFFGPAYLFQTNCLSATPFKALKNGFSFREEEFVKPDESFYYMNNEATRVYTCRNSDNYPLVYNEYLAGGVYQLYVFRRSNIILSGFDKGNGSTPRINDMEKLRAKYFCQSITSQFFHLHFGCNYKPINADSLANELDQFVVDLCSHLLVDTTNIPKITTYIYSNREDLQQFIAANSSQTVYGKSFGNTNHIMHFDLAIFKHEAGHSIIASKAGKNTNPFFDEGFRQYTDYFFSNEAYENDLKNFRDNAHLLTPELVLSTNNTYFNSMANYSISGVFVKYIIDKIGLDIFKKAFSSNSLIETIESKMGKTEEIVKTIKNDNSKQ